MEHFGSAQRTSQKLFPRQAKERKSSLNIKANLNCHRHVGFPIHNPRLPNPTCKDQQSPRYADPQAERQKYITAFNNTMLKIWREQITLLDVIDTGRLLNSPKSVQTTADGRFIEATLSQAFLECGLWQDFGTGKEIPRGNPGDIGRDRKRKPKRWFSRKYYASVMNLNEFMADNMGHEFVGIVAKSLDDRYRRYNH